MGVSEDRGTSFWGPDSKDPTIEGIILGSPIFGNSHIYIGHHLRCIRPHPELLTCAAAAD